MIKTEGKLRGDYSTSLVDNNSEIVSWNYICIQTII